MRWSSALHSPSDFTWESDCPTLVLPGLLPNITHAEIKSSRYYKKCETMKGRNVYHCEDCDVCIDRYDHNSILFLFMTFGTL